MKLHSKQPVSGKLHPGMSPAIIESTGGYQRLKPIRRRTACSLIASVICCPLPLSAASNETRIILFEDRRTDSLQICSLVGGVGPSGSASLSNRTGDGPAVELKYKLKAGHFQTLWKDFDATILKKGKQISENEHLEYSKEHYVIYKACSIIGKGVDSAWVAIPRSTKDKAVLGWIKLARCEGYTDADKR